MKDHDHPITPSAHIIQAAVRVVIQPAVNGGYEDLACCRIDGGSHHLVWTVGSRFILRALLAVDEFPEYR